MSFIAHGPGPSDSEIFFFLAFAAAWFLSGLLLWINLPFFLSLRASAAFKAANAGWWICYAAPWLFLTFRPISRFFSINFSPSAGLRLAIGVTIPMVTFGHFAFLCWTRRRVGSR